MKFQPDYHNIVDAATNKKPKRIPLYDHIIADEVMEAVLKADFASLIKNDGTFGGGAIRGRLRSN